MHINKCSRMKETGKRHRTSRIKVAIWGRTLIDNLYRPLLHLKMTWKNSLNVLYLTRNGIEWLHTVTGLCGKYRFTSADIPVLAKHKTIPDYLTNDPATSIKLARR